MKMHEIRQLKKNKQANIKQMYLNSRLRNDILSHVHEMAWFPGAPYVEKLVTPRADFDPIEAAEEIIS